MWEGIIGLLLRVSLSFIDFYMKKKKKDTDMYNSYMEFLRHLDQSGAESVANHMAAKNAEEDLIEKLEKDKK